MPGHTLLFVADEPRLVAKVLGALVPTSILALCFLLL